jgi:Chaperone of endosialidase
MQSYNAILNQYDPLHCSNSNDGDGGAIIPLPVQQIAITRPFIFNVDAPARLRQLMSYIGLVDETVQDTVLRLIGVQEAIASTESQVLALQDNESIQNQQLAVLEDGKLLNGRIYSNGLNGGAILAIKQNGELDALGVPAPVSLELATYDSADTISASLLLQGDLVTIGPHVRIPGDLLLGESNKTVQDQLVDLQQRVVEELASIAANYALDAAQQALIAGLALLLKPKGYEALPDSLPDEEFPDSNSIPPIRCFPRAKFVDELPDELGNVVERINSKGKITVSADVLPTFTMTVGGDAWFMKVDEDDSLDVDYVCNLGTKVQKLDAQLNLINPLDVVCRIGGNMNVQASGAINAESLNVDAVVTGKVNGVPTNRLIQRYPPSIDLQLNKRVANVTTQALTARRAAIKPVLSRSYDDHLARIYAELLALKKGAYTAKPVLARSYYDDIARIHAELLSLKRSAYTKPVLTKSYDEAIVSLSTDVLALKRGAFTKASIPVRDNTRAIGTVRDTVNTIKAYTTPISTSTTSALNIVGTLGVSGGLTTLGAGLTVSAGNVNFAVNDASTLTMGTTTITNPILWSSNASALALPSVSNAGTRLRLYGNGSSTATNDYALGISSGGMWYNVNLNAKHMFTSAGVQLAEIASAGSIFTTPVTVTGLSTLASVSSTNTTTTNLTVTNTLTLPPSVVTTGTVSSNSLIANTLTVNGNATINGNLNITGTLNTVNTEQINVQDKLIILASDSEGSLLTGAGIQIGFDVLDPIRLTWNNTTFSLDCTRKMKMPSLVVTGASTLAGVTATTLTATGTSTLAGVTATTLTATGTSTLAGVTATTLTATGTSTLAGVTATTLTATGTSTLAGVTATTLTATGTSTLAGVSATTLTATGTSTLAGVSATTLSTSGQATINGILRVGVAGTSTIANYQGGTIYFAGPFGDSVDAYSGVCCKNYVNGTSNSEATELLLWQLNDPYADSGPDRIRLYAGEIRFDTYSASAAVGSQYTESTKMIVMPTGYVGIGTTNPTATLHISAGVGVNSTIPNLALTNGVGFGASSLPQLSFGYQGTKTYNHYISTRHTGSAGGNSIDFYTCDGTQSNTINGTVYCCTMQNGRLGVNTFNPTDTLHVTGNSTFAGLIQCRGCRYTQGAAATQYGNAINFFWTGAALEAWVDNTKVTNNISDYRVKKGIASLGPSLDKILALRPVTYSLKDNGIFKGNDTILEGFIAHEVQQIIPSGVNGVKDAKDKDGVDLLQSLNVMPILSTLVKAVQELTARVQALEGLKMHR